MSSGKSHLTVRQQGDITIVGFLTQSILDQASINAIGAELVELVEVKQRKRILIDLSGVKFFSSSMIGRLIGLKKKVTEARGQLKLCSIDPSIMEIFTTMRLHKVFDIQPDEPTAVAKFVGGAR